MEKKELQLSNKTFDYDRWLLKFDEDNNPRTLFEGEDNGAEGKEGMGILAEIKYAIRKLLAEGLIVQSQKIRHLDAYKLTDEGLAIIKEGGWTSIRNRERRQNIYREEMDKLQRDNLISQNLLNKKSIEIFYLTFGISILSLLISMFSISKDSLIYEMFFK